MKVKDVIRILIQERDEILIRVKQIEERLIEINDKDMEEEI